MDIVVTYVDATDRQWQQDYYRTTHTPIMAKRFRDWGTLKYLFRGIETYMPFIQDIYLVVARPSQVPHWISSAVRIVYHQDIIPQQFLPTFNAQTIELFLHKIEGLSEQFIYFNDDCFPIAPCTKEDFFWDNKIKLGFSKHYLALGMFKKVTRHADHVAQQLLGLTPSIAYIRPQHTCTPMFKTQNETVYSAIEPNITEYVSSLRQLNNLNQYVFSDFLYYQGLHFPNTKISNKHFSLAAHSMTRICQYLLRPQHKIVNINDVEMSEQRFNRDRAQLLDTFEMILPTPSRFEKPSINAH